MRRIVGYPKFYFLVLFIIATGGCINLDPQEDPTRIFVLKEISPMGSSGSEKTLSVGIRRINLPAYLNSSKIVIRKGDHEVVHSDYHRWGEDLDVAIGRNLAGRLAESLSEAEVVRFPWPDKTSPDYVVEVEILRFDGDESTYNAKVQAKWMIRDSEAAKPTPTTHGKTDFRKSWDGRSFVALVASLDRGLAVMGGQISEAIRGMMEAE